MNARIARRLLKVLVSVAVLSFTSIAHAGLFRAYLSASGNDANSCIVTQPCRLLPAALNAVNDGGEIWIVDSANYNTGTVNVTKSVTILAIPGAVGSIVANGGDAISINAASVSVTLRNLNVLNLSGGVNAGVSLQQGSTLTVEGCEFYGLQAAIALTAANSVTVIRDTVLRDSFYAFFTNGTVDATLDHARISGNSYGVVAQSGAHVTVSGSVLSNNATGLFATGSASGTVLVVARSTITGSPTATGIEVSAAPGWLAEAFAENNVLHVGTGFKFAHLGGTESIYTSGDNRLVFYAAGASGGALTPMAAY